MKFMGMAGKLARGLVERDFCADRPNKFKEYRGSNDDGKQGLA